MKLRLKHDSLRLRLGPSEVRALVAGERVSESVSFAAGALDRLSYSVTSTARVTAPTVTFENNHIDVRLPAEMVTKWAESNEVAIEAKHAIDPRRTLSLLIEKDFACMHGEEENIDVFPNPRQGHEEEAEPQINADERG